MTFLVDMNLSPGWVPLLVAAGFEAAHWSSVGAAAEADEHIMAYAERHGHVVLTSDLDFGVMLARTNAARPSVAQLRMGNLRPSRVGERVVWEMQRLQSELEAGALVTVDELRTRIRVLPVRPD